MQKPSCYSQGHASAFQEAPVADAYAYRPPYPPGVFTLLVDLLPHDAQRLLDVGCGTGAVARHLIHLGLPIDAVDISEAMVTRGKQLPNGDHSLLQWHIGAIETVDLTPPYGLITAGESLHWMEWETILPRFAHLLQSNGNLVILDLGHETVPWSAELGKLIQQYSTNQTYQPIDLIAELTSRGLFAEKGRTTTAPWPFKQSVEAYVESFHGRASFSRERMRTADAETFDNAVQEAVRQYTQHDVELPIVATVVWGKPLAST